MLSAARYLLSPMVCSALLVALVACRSPRASDMKPAPKDTDTVQVPDWRSVLQEPHQRRSVHRPSIAVAASSSARTQSPQQPSAVVAELLPQATAALLSRMTPLLAPPTISTDRATGPAAPTLDPAKWSPSDRTRAQPRPAPPAPTSAPTEPLKVVRFGPEGRVARTAEVSLTFSQPMIALSSFADASTSVPAVIEPPVPGRWRWVGVDTAVFEPEARLPAATRFGVRVASDIRSAAGARLSAPLRYHFTTDAPKLDTDRTYPNPQHTTGLEPPIVLFFQDSIDPVWVLQNTRIMVDGQAIATRFLTEEELRAYIAQAHRHADAVAERPSSGVAAVARMPERLFEAIADLLYYHGRSANERFVLLRAVEPLPGNSSVRVMVAPAAQPATRATRSFEFRTYGPLTGAELKCIDICAHDGPWRVALANEIVTIEPEAVTIAPDVPITVEVEDGELEIRVDGRAETQYRVRLDGDIRDVFGQTLAAPQVVAVRTADPRPEPSVLEIGENLRILDPQAPASTVTIRAERIERVRVTVRRVQPADWLRYEAHESWSEDDGRARPPLPGSVTAQTIYRPDADGVIRIDVSSALTSGIGHALVEIEALDWVQGTDERPDIVHLWVQKTTLAVDAFGDASELLARVTRLADGAPLAGAVVQIMPQGVSGRSDRQGLASLALTKRSDDGESAIVVASRGMDSVFVPVDELSQLRADGPSHSWYVFDDRSLYLPGETVQVKGWLRHVPQDKRRNDLHLPRATEIDYRLVDRRGRQLAEGRARLSPVGGFSMSLAIPDGAALGRARLELSVAGADKSRHQFEIAQFRRPEFAVTVRRQQPVALAGRPIRLTAEASYFTGGGLPRATSDWDLSVKFSTFSPPGHPLLTFGLPPISGSSRAEWTGSTDQTGRHGIEVTIESQEPRPMAVSAGARVTDINRYAFAGATSVVVHPAQVYLGLRTDRLFMAPGTSLEVDALAVGLDGTPVANRPIAISMVRHHLVADASGWREIAEAPETCRQTSAATARTCRFSMRGPGRYSIVGSVRDADGRENRTELTRWVSGGEREPAGFLEREEVRVVADRDAYAPGDRAQLLIEAPFSPARALLTVRRAGLIEVREFELRATTQQVSVDIRAGYTPNVHVEVDLVGAAVRENADGILDSEIPVRPAFASGGVTLSVPPEHRRLAVTVTPKKSTLPPGGETQLDIAVADANGRPVMGAEVAVVVVDEAILALSDKHSPDPLPSFHRARDQGVETVYARNWVELVDPSLFKAPDPEPSAARQGRRARPPQVRIGNALSTGRSPIATRTQFDALAHFSPRLGTDKNGSVTVPVSLPDSVTRYRIMVAAAHGANRFGAAESSVTASLPLMVRPSPPRFLRAGDRVEIPVLVSNRSQRRRTVDVALRAVGIDLVSAKGTRAGVGRRVEIAANDRIEVRFPAVAQRAGQAHLQVAASDDNLADSSSATIPITGATEPQAMATYGSLTGGATRQVIAQPEGALDSFGGLELTVSTSQALELADALVSLIDYPHACSEQLASRILAVLALRRALAGMGADGLPSPDELAGVVGKDLAELARRQRHDGSFGVWTRRGPSRPFYSIHVAHALARARASGLEVAPLTYDAAREHLRGLLGGEIGSGAGDGANESGASLAAQWVTRAYALYVLRSMGDEVAASAKRLLAGAGGADQLPVDAQALVVAALADSPATSELRAPLLRAIMNHVRISASEATVTSSFPAGDGYRVLHSARRTDSLALAAILATKPESDLVSKLARGLLGGRRSGVWASTHENGFSLLALARYLEVYERVTPDIVSKVWLDGRYVGQKKLRGRTAETQRVTVGMDRLGRSPVDVVLGHQGQGRMYYRLAMRYALADGMQPAAAHGFSVVRRYEAIDRPDDIRPGPSGPDSVAIRAGARVRVRVEFFTPTPRIDVALTDRLPAGLEALSVERSTSTRGIFEHIELGDRRVSGYAARLPAGTWTLSYLAIAATPGEYTAAPARAETMYAPETFGRSAATRVHIKADDTLASVL